MNYYGYLETDLEFLRDAYFAFSGDTFDITNQKILDETIAYCKKKNKYISKEHAMKYINEIQDGLREHINNQLDNFETEYLHLLSEEKNEFDALDEYVMAEALKKCPKTNKEIAHKFLIDNSGRLKMRFEFIHGQDSQHYEDELNDDR